MPGFSERTTGFGMSFNFIVASLIVCVVAILPSFLLNLLDFDSRNQLIIYVLVIGIIGFYILLPSAMPVMLLVCLLAILLMLSHMYYAHVRKKKTFYSNASTDANHGHSAVISEWVCNRCGTTNHGDGDCWCYSDPNPPGLY